MANLGGIGAFAGGFATNFAAGLKQRKLREQMDIENAAKIRKEKRLSEQFEQQQGLREQQFEALQEYRSGQRQLQQKQMEIQQKDFDLKTMGAWEKILDPTKDKSMRKFMFKQLSSTLGIDPKSQQAKDFEGMISSMGDESLAEIRNALLAMLPDATPGQIAAISKAIISGQMEMKDAVDALGEAAKNKRVANKLSLGVGGEQETEEGASGSPSSALTSKTPMSAQKAPGGTLPVPGMEGTTGGGKAEENTQTFTAEQLRNKAIELAQDPDFEPSQVQLFVTLARDMEKAKEDKLQLKQIVTTDAEGNRTEKWVPIEEAVGKEAPSGRPVPSREEAASAKEAEALAELDVKRLEPVHERADTAREMLPQIETYRQLLRTGKFQTGSFSGFRESLGQIARLAGIDDNTLEVLAGLKVGDPAIAESLSAISNQMGLTFAGEVSRLTNMSLQLITGALPSLLKTPEGNEIVLEVYEAKGKQAIEIDDLAEQYIDQHGTLRPKGKPSFFEERAKIMRKSYLEPDFEERFLNAEKAGKGVDLTKIIQGAKKEAIILFKKAEDGEQEEVVFENVGKHETGLPLVKLSDGNDYPYAATKKDSHKLPTGTLYLMQDPLKGPKLMRAE